jgi:hypothetical protein
MFAKPGEAAIFADFCCSNQYVLLHITKILLQRTQTEIADQRIN